ncbi:MAG: phosphotransferase [Eubacteriales bacterium]|nr:phosphotransferase [Eubacteriales bacterium]
MTSKENLLVQEALAHYALEQPQVEFLRHSENITCRVTSPQGSFVLRIRCPAPGFELNLLNGGYLPTELTDGETARLLHLSRAGLFPVQQPQPCRDGALFCVLSDGSPACLLSWLGGEALTEKTAADHAQAMGRLAAKIHRASAGFRGPRLSYCHDLIDVLQAEIGSAGAAAHITPAQRESCLGALCEIDAVMTQLDAQTDSRALLHCDMGFGNVLATPQGLAPIDFSLSGFGYRVQECGMIASNYNDPALRRAVCRGYEEESGISFDPHHVDAFFSLSVLLFIACQHGRFFSEDWFAAAMDRWCRTCFDPLSQQILFAL